MHHSSPYALPYWQTAIDEDNAIMQQIAQENDALFLDYEALAPTDTALWSRLNALQARWQFSAGAGICAVLDRSGRLPDAEAANP